MKFFASLGVFVFALSFCGLVERFTGRRETTAPPSNSAANSNLSNPALTPPADESFAKPTLTSEQSAILASGKEVKWDEQGLAWTLPGGWRKISQNRTLFNYGSPDGAFLIVSVSPLAADFPADISLKANYDGTVTRQKNGEVESVRYLELDGTKGVEFVETMPEDKSGARRHQWIGFRKYAGQLQMLNIMLSTKGSNFDKNRDTFAAVLASTKITK